MRTSPNAEEKLKNAALFLCLAGRLSRRGVIGDRLKVQKCTFLAAHKQFQERLKGFNLRFYRFDYGPFSKQLWDLRDILMNAGLLEERKQTNREFEELALTASGKALADDLARDILEDDRNVRFTETIEDTARLCTEKHTGQIMDYVYGLEVEPVDGPSQSIRDMPQGVDIIRVLEPHEASAEIAISEGWMETLAILLSKENQEGLARAERDLSDGKVYSHDQVWA